MEWSKPVVQEVALCAQGNGRHRTLGSLGLDLPREPPLCRPGALTAASHTQQPLVIWPLFYLFIYFALFYCGKIDIT